MTEVIVPLKRNPVRLQKIVFSLQEEETIRVHEFVSRTRANSQRQKFSSSCTTSILGSCMR